MRLLTALLLCLAALPALAIDYRSISGDAILYDAPSVKGVKHFIIARGTPVEVVLTQEYWTKVRDSSGNMAWIEARLLSPARTLIVRADKADVRAEANEKSTVVFSAEKNVLLELIDTTQNPTPGWAKVKHRDDRGGELGGFVRASQVWGL